MGVHKNNETNTTTMQIKTGFFSLLLKIHTTAE